MGNTGYSHPVSLEDLDEQNNTEVREEQPENTKVSDEEDVTEVEFEEDTISEDAISTDNND